MENECYRDESVPLITYEEGVYRVNEEAIELISHIPKPISVIGIVGQYRTGKSYLLNRILLNRGDGFPISSTINVCTKGIWIWGRPIKARTEKGELTNLLVLDSEGLGSNERDRDYDCKIFVFILLLSSVILYNQIGAIDENSLLELSLIAELTNFVQINKSSFENFCDVEEEGGCEGYGDYFPSFYWILRDFSLKMEDQKGNAINNEQYLSNSLQEQDKPDTLTQKKNNIRKLIKSFFQTRQCHPLIRPIIDEECLGNLQQYQLESLRPEFVSQALSLRQNLLSNAKLKLIKGKQIDGKILSELIKSYIKTFNEKDIPCVFSTWDAISNKQAHQLEQECFQLFDELLNEKIITHLPVNNTALRLVVKQQKQEVLKYFRINSFYQTGDQFPFIQKIKEGLYQRVNQVKQQNEQIFTQGLISMLNERFDQKILLPLQQRNMKTVEILNENLSFIENELLQDQLSGPKKQQTIYMFLYRRGSEAFKIFFQQNLSVEKEVWSKEEQQFKTIIRELKEQLEQLNNKNQQQNQSLFLLQQENKEKEFSVQEWEQKAKILENEKKRLEKEFGEFSDNHKKDNKKKFSDMLEQIQNHKNEINRLKAEKVKELSELNADMDLKQQTINILQTTKEDLNLQLSELSKRVKMMSEQHQETIMSIKVGEQESSKNYIQQIQQLKTNIQELKNELFSADKKHKNDIFEQKTKFQQIIDDKENQFQIQNVELICTIKQLQDKLDQEYQQHIIANEDLERKLQQQELNSHKYQQQCEKNKQEKNTLIKENDKLKQQILESQAIFEQNNRKSQQSFYNRKLQQESFRSEQQNGPNTALLELANSYQERFDRQNSDYNEELRQMNEQLQMATEELDYQQEQFNQEIQKYKYSIVDLENAKNDYAKECYSLKEQLQFQQQQYQEQLQQLKENYQSNIQKLQREIEEGNEKYQKEQNEQQQMYEEQLEQTRSLHQQEINMLQNKMQEERLRLNKAHERALCDCQEKYQEQLRNQEIEKQALKEDYEQTINEIQHKYNDELSEWENRYEEKKGSTDKIQQAYQEKIKKNEQQRSFLIERLKQYQQSQFEQQLSEKMDDKKLQIEQLQGQNGLIRQQLDHEIKQREQQEQTIQELQGQIDKFQAAYQTKMQHYDSQLKKAKYENVKQMLQQSSSSKPVNLDYTFHNSNNSYLQNQIVPKYTAFNNFKLD